MAPNSSDSAYVNIKELHELGIQWQGRYREREQAKMPWPSSESVKYWQVLISTIHLEGRHLHLYQKAYLGVQKQKKSTMSSKGKVNTRRGSSRTIISSGGPWSTGRICGAARPFIKGLLNSNRHKLVVGDTQSDSIQYLNFAKKWFIQYSIQYCFNQDSIQNIIQFTKNLLIHFKN